MLQPTVIGEIDATTEVVANLTKNESFSNPITTDLQPVIPLARMTSFRIVVVSYFIADLLQHGMTKHTHVAVNSPFQTYHVHICHGLHCKMITGSQSHATYTNTYLI